MRGTVRRCAAAKWSDARHETHRVILREALHQIDHAHGIGVHLPPGACARACGRALQSPLE